MCRVLKVSSSGYYKWKTHKEDKELEVAANPLLQGEAAKYLNVDLPYSVQLKKTYRFNTDQSFADISLSGSISPPTFDHREGTQKIYAAWLIQDAAFMDFTDSTALNVHSLVGDTIDSGGVWFTGREIVPSRIVQYRLRPHGRSIASSFEAPDADISFVIPVPLSWSLFDRWFEVPHEGISPPNRSQSNISRTHDMFWSFGRGFYFDTDLNLNRLARIRWLSGFDSPIQLSTIWKKENSPSLAQKQN